MVLNAKPDWPLRHSMASAQRTRELLRCVKCELSAWLWYDRGERGVNGCWATPLEELLANGTRALFLYPTHACAQAIGSNRRGDDISADYAFVGAAECLVSAWQDTSSIRERRTRILEELAHLKASDAVNDAAHRARDQDLDGYASGAERWQGPPQRIGFVLTPQRGDVLCHVLLELVLPAVVCGLAAALWLWLWLCTARALSLLWRVACSVVLGLAVWLFLSTQRMWGSRTLRDMAREGHALLSACLREQSGAMACVSVATVDFVGEACVAEVVRFNRRTARSRRGVV